MKRTPTARHLGLFFGVTTMAILIVSTRDAQTQITAPSLQKAQSDRVGELSQEIDKNTAPIEQLMERAKLYRSRGEYQKAIDDCSRILAMWEKEEALEERALNYSLLGEKQLSEDDTEELIYQRTHTAKFILGPKKYAKSNAESRRQLDGQRVGISSVVPTGLTQVEYFHLAQKFGGNLPRQALECIDKVETMNPNRPIATKATRLRDTMLPKQFPSDEAIALNYRSFECILDHDKCRQLVAKCLALYPETEYAYVTLGALEKDCGNEEAAIAALQHALKLNPHNSDALCRLGDILRWHKVPEAKKVLTQAASYGDTLAGYLLELYKFDN